MNNYLPLSHLNQILYCPRRFWYMYMQGEIEINAPMLEGIFQHQTRADKPGQETGSDPTSSTAHTIHRRLWVWSDRLNIAGFADFVEIHQTPSTSSQQLIPVEYKHGKKGNWDNDNVQLCAQALCLEEMTNQPVEQGEIFYWRSRQRITVPFDNQLRQMTEQTIQQAFQLIAQNTIPPPIHKKQKCTLCSIQPICLPQEVNQLHQGITTR
ncbi:MAG: CRISPR-associated protein Cas4 [Chloroflexi bacterium]|nr:MAG: CRISPR-associated protein Cas4 [Chloroflexota bacterium]PIE81613.1 MAG: CRISPR-associated protein Cas4 [Chloroflexota bacterium]